MCGVFGVYAPGQKVSRLTFDGLFALQHRGQESAGMAVGDGKRVTVVRDMGLVAHVFDERSLTPLSGDVCIGHTRYPTAGANEWGNAQPVYRSIGEAGFALAHNGNLTNVAALTPLVNGEEVGSDSDLVAELIAQEYERHLSKIGNHPSAHAERRRTDQQLLRALHEVLPKLEGAFSFVVLTEQQVIGIRDPQGFRPLCLGRLDDGWVLASETPALDIVGAHFVRELDPGELVVIDGNGLRSFRPFDATTQPDPKLCIFEFVYFARPDSVLYDHELHAARTRMGRKLADQLPVEADVVIGVPDSGVPAAEGYARQSGIPFGIGLVKNRYIARTFISPDQEQRANSVRRKLNPLRSEIAGKRVIVVDDSIVRGTTTRALVGILRDAGAKEVHLRISSPPYRWPCFYGLDTPKRSELLAANLEVGEIQKFLGVDSLSYLTLDNLVAAIEAPGAGFCTACLTGDYPTAIPTDSPVMLIPRPPKDADRLDDAESEAQILQFTRPKSES